MNDTTIYNVYSSGENIHGNIGHDQGNLAHLDGYTWGCQEKLKGRMFESTDSLCNDKNVFFLHGFKVTEADAHGWNSEFFKRLYWSGSNAKFWGVT